MLKMISAIVTLFMASQSFAEVTPPAGATKVYKHQNYQSEIGLYLMRDIYMSNGMGFSIHLQAPGASLDNDSTKFVFPPTNGTSGDFLSVDGSGVTSWESFSNKTFPEPTVTGTLLLQNASGSQPILQLSEDPDNGTNKITLQAPATLASDWTLTLPTDDGSNGQVLTTDGSGAASWSNTPPPSTDILAATDNYTILDGDGYEIIDVTTSPSDITFSSRSSNVINFSANHGLATGQPLVFNGAGTIPTGMAAGHPYYAIVIDADSASFATTIANALAGTAVTLSGDGSGTRTWQKGVAITLPTAAANTGRSIQITKSTASTDGMVAIVPETASETIDLYVGITIATRQNGVTLVSNGTIWKSYGRDLCQSFVTNVAPSSGAGTGPTNYRLYAERCGFRMSAYAKATTGTGSPTSEIEWTTRLPSWAWPTIASTQSTGLSTSADILYFVTVREDGDFVLQRRLIDNAADAIAVDSFATSTTYDGNFSALIGF